MKKYIFFVALFFSIANHSNGQLTPKDFKLCIDNIGCSDSTIKITKAQLLKANLVTPNFSWFTITYLTVYVSGSDVTVAQATGDKLAGPVRSLFEKAGPGTHIVIEAKGHNKQGKNMFWGSLSLIVTE
jgi:hypothetical protein